MEMDAYLRFILALVFVLALIGGLAWAVRRFNLVRGAVRPMGGPRRLEIVEIAPLDAKRRLALIRRDDTEHLILLGPASEIVVETGIAGETRPQAGDLPA